MSDSKYPTSRGWPSGQDLKLTDLLPPKVSAINFFGALFGAAASVSWDWSPKISRGARKLAQHLSYQN